MEEELASVDDDSDEVRLEASLETEAPLSMDDSLLAAEETLLATEDSTLETLDSAEELRLLTELLELLVDELPPPQAAKLSARLAVKKGINFIGYYSRVILLLR